jgi:2-polyprenyl-6-methoxyphenol hydroxylase-like FAD-dependent oxidoreductase
MKNIAIIGGGIAGLTFSLFLQNKDFHIEIFEKRENVAELGVSITLFPNALRVYKELGIYEDILKKGRRLEGAYLKSEDGKILKQTHQKTEIPVICILRSDLHSILLNRLKLNLHLNCEITSLKAIVNKIECIFSDGTKKVFDTVIGADGLNSKVREFVVDGKLPIYSGYTMWRGVCNNEFNIEIGGETLGKGKRFGIVPLNNGKISWWASQNIENKKQNDNKITLLDDFKNFHQPISKIINSTENIIISPIYDRNIKKGWYKNNIVLLGDSVHPTSPNLGQGACTAIEGAYILAESIISKGLNEKAYNQYEKYQFPRAEFIVNLSRRIGNSRQTENNIKLFLQKFFIKYLPSSIGENLTNTIIDYDVTTKFKF